MLDPPKVFSQGFGPHSFRCSECKKAFRPHPRLKARQLTCTQLACRSAHRARYRRKYRRGNQEGEADSQSKVKSNRTPGFWKNYRAINPQSSDRNRVQTRLRKQLKQAGLQRQLDIVQVFDRCVRFFAQ
jgi:hypothetical protein